MARTKDEILKDIRRVECGLSPENLYCDGEISRTQARVKEHKLLAERRVLIKELGREPTWNEIWGM
jgi:CDGSH-type Zn-finger protein